MITPLFAFERCKNKDQNEGKNKIFFGMIGFFTFNQHNVLSSIFKKIKKRTQPLNLAENRFICKGYTKIHNELQLGMARS